ncbi:MAG: hypothetical protein AB1505_04860 [Candidatus Latescibacterota bacterium]
MRHALVFGGFAVFVWAAGANAQGISSGAVGLYGRFAVHYDPYYVMPAEKGGAGLDAGLNSWDLSSLGDRSDVFVSGKYGVIEGVEVGATATVGSLFEYAPGVEKEALSAVVVGAKYQTLAAGATTVDVLLPVGDAGDPGLALGQMWSTEMGNLGFNNHLQVSFLDGYVVDGVNLDLLIQPVKEFGDGMFGYLDVEFFANTDEFGDTFNIDLLPNVDVMLAEGLLLNGGVRINVYNGTDRSSDVGVRAGLIKTMELGGGY